MKLHRRPALVDRRRLVSLSAIRRWRSDAPLTRLKNSPLLEFRLCHDKLAVPTWRVRLVG
jgi:hypothetical protein